MTRSAGRPVDLFRIIVWPDFPQPSRSSGSVFGVNISSVLVYNRHVVFGARPTFRTSRGAKAGRGSGIAPQTFLTGACKLAVQEKLLSVGTALVAASPAATAADAESPAATAAAAESLALPAATAQQAGDMAIATFECVSRLGSLCLVSSAFRGPEVRQDVLPTTPPSQFANISALGCGGSAADGDSTRGFCTSVWHAWFCGNASRRRCPDCLVCQSKQGQHISLHGHCVFGGWGGPQGASVSGSTVWQ